MWRLVHVHRNGHTERHVGIPKGTHKHISEVEWSTLRCLSTKFGGPEGKDTDIIPLLLLKIFSNDTVVLLCTCIRRIVSRTTSTQSDNNSYRTHSMNDSGRDPESKKYTFYPYYGLGS